MAMYDIRAHWDAEAHVWWAESEDVPGLVAEARTHDGLIEELRLLVPELLRLNLPDVEHETVSFRVVSDQVEDVRHAGCPRL